MVREHSPVVSDSGGAHREQEDRQDGDDPANALAPAPIAAGDELVDRSPVVAAAGNTDATVANDAMVLVRDGNVTDENRTDENGRYENMGRLKPKINAADELFGPMCGLTEERIEFLKNYHSEYGRSGPEHRQPTEIEAED